MAIVSEVRNKLPTDQADLKFRSISFYSCLVAITITIVLILCHNF